MNKNTEHSHTTHGMWIVCFPLRRLFVYFLLLFVFIIFHDRVWAPQWRAFRTVKYAVVLAGRLNESKHATAGWSGHSLVVCFIFNKPNIMVMELWSSQCLVILANLTVSNRQVIVCFRKKRGWNKYMGIEGFGRVSRLSALLCTNYCHSHLQPGRERQPRVYFSICPKSFIRLTAS